MCQLSPTPSAYVKRSRPVSLTSGVYVRTPTPSVLMLVLIYSHQHSSPPPLQESMLGVMVQAYYSVGWACHVPYALYVRHVSYAPCAPCVRHVYHAPPCTICVPYTSCAPCTTHACPVHSMTQIMGVTNHPHLKNSMSSSS